MLPNVPDLTGSDSNKIKVLEIFLKELVRELEFILSSLDDKNFTDEWRDKHGV